MLSCSWRSSPSSPWAARPSCPTRGPGGRRARSRPSSAKSPLFAAALEDEPSLREPLQEAVREGFRGGGSGEAVAAGLRLLSPRLWRSVPGASDAAAEGLGRALVATLTDLQARDPQQCYRFLFPAVAGPPAGGGSPRDEGLLRALGAAALSARDGSAEPLDRRAAARQLEAVYGRLRERHGSDVDVLKNAQAPDADRSRVCAMRIALYAELVALPPKAAGQALRHVLGPAEPAAPGHRVVVPVRPVILGATSGAGRSSRSARCRAR